MAKSVNEYYSEKMKKLLEMQNSTSAPALPSKSSSQRNKAPEETGAKSPTGRGYYDSFRSRVDADKRTAGSERGRQPLQNGRRPAAQRKQNPLERTVIDDIRENKRPGTYPRSGAPRPAGQASSGAGRGADGRMRPKISPEQTASDKYAETVKQIEAMQTAKRARMLRKVRDIAVSVALIIAVFVFMCIAVYRLVFVISDIKTVGNSAYSSDELVLASGISKGDHLYSFSSREMSELLTLRLPEISSVDVDRTPPGKIVINVEEEKPAFYADFYGEYRLLSPTLRILTSVTLEDAKAQGCVKLIIPDIKNATAGLTPEFADVRDDDYIYKTCKTLNDSPLKDRAGTLDLSDKYNITLTVDGKYIVKLGDSESMEMKLKIANAVLADEMFNKDIKATVDVTKLSETSVVVDEGLVID